MIGRVTRRVLGSAAGAVDRAATLAVQARNNVRRSVALTTASDAPPRVALLQGFAASYPASLGDDFFLPPCPISPVARELPNELGFARASDLSWASDYRPFMPAISERYLRTPENCAAGVRLLESGERRPVAILIHGYMAGSYQVEQRVWPLQRLLRSGYDVALFTLPFHGVRANAARRGAPEFPGSDPRFSNEGFRQVIADLRNFVRWLRERGHPEVGVMGMSLGGYTAALLATVEPGLSFCVPVIPLASLADFVREQGVLSGAPEEEAREHALLESIYRVVSPLERKPLIVPARTLVVAAKADRITPVAHARKLAAHFGAQLVSWHGGHLLQLGRNAAFRRVETLLRDLRGRPI
ncbi:MAG TPA: alpha/beta hydrolase family protein [Polyangiaceae bacterium]|nr:alpha/beta hydrolase family protein [Polyangiaceae bacterium]